MNHLSLQPMPVCCGADVIGYFGWSTTNGGAMGPRDLNALEQDLRDADKMLNVGLRLATLSEEQVPYAEYLLEKFGYKVLVRDFIGPNHNKKITLYGKLYSGNKDTKMPDLRYHGKTERINNETPRAKAPVQTTEGEALRLTETGPVRFNW